MYHWKMFRIFIQVGIPYSRIRVIWIFPHGNSNDCLSQFVSLCNVVTLLFVSCLVYFQQEKTRVVSRGDSRDQEHFDTWCEFICSNEIQNRSRSFQRRVRKRLLSIGKTFAVKHGSTVLVLGWVATRAYMVL